MPVFVFLSADVNRRLFSSGFSRTVFLTILAPFACYIDDAFFTGSMRIGVVDAGRGTVFHICLLFCFFYRSRYCLIDRYFFLCYNGCTGFSGVLFILFFRSMVFGFFGILHKQTGQPNCPVCFFLFFSCILFCSCYTENRKKRISCSPLGGVGWRTATVPARTVFGEEERYVRCRSFLYCKGG